MFTYYVMNGAAADDGGDDNKDDDAGKNLVFMKTKHDRVSSLSEMSIIATILLLLLQAGNNSLK